MIKHINTHNVSTTPFVAAKSRALFNIQNADCVVTEVNGYPDQTKIALDYVDYNSGNPLVNSECNIALEQQDSDSLGFEEGITGSGQFDPNTDPLNADGTYKRLVHRTIKNSFYNTYRNPTEILGVEHIDFPLSKTLRNISDSFRMFSIPRLMFGDKIQPKSVLMFDNLFDDNVTIFDDGFQNLVAGYNLFSKVQEVQKFGWTNEIITGTASFSCPSFGSEVFVTDPTSVFIDIGGSVQFAVSASGFPTPITFQWYNGNTALVDSGHISGSRGPVVYINNIWFTDTGSYRVSAFNTEGNKATSAAAALHINLYPPVISDPVSVSVEVGSPMTFSVALSSGRGPLTWQWQSGSYLLSNNARITGSNTASLTINNAQISDSGSYRVMVSNIYSGVTSSYADGKIILHPPLILTNPVNQTTYETLTASFSVTASGTLPMTYQWVSGSTFLVDTTRISGSSITGSTTSRLQINNAQFTDSGSYKVLVSNIAGTVYSNTASLTVLDNTIRTSGSDAMGSSIALRFGSLDAAPPSTEGSIPSFGTAFKTGSVITMIQAVNIGNETASVALAFDGGFIFNTILTASNSTVNETASVSMGFEAGSIFNVILTASNYGVNETASVSMAFSGGYLTTVVTQSLTTEAIMGFGISLISGSVF